MTGVDLVREMLRIADGEPLRWRQQDISLRGAAIECRLNAEDPQRNFAPSPGRVDQLRWPGGPGVRVDSMLYPGCTVSPYYDSLLAKLIVWDEDRGAALARLARALDEVELEGVHSTLALHRALAQDPEVVAGDYHTNWLEAWMRAEREGSDERALHPWRRRIHLRRDQRGHVAGILLQGHGHHPRAARARGRRRDRDLPGQRILSGALRPRSHRADALLALLRELEDGIDMANLSLDTRIIEIPVYYNDPWTHETLMRFRERHQDPASTDLEYAARINGFASVQAFIDAHAGSPWFVSMVGFVAGLPFMFQMVERERQLQVPKYLRPRTGTPRHTVGHGGCFGCIYSVRGAGGYQMFGVTPAPIFEPGQRLAHLRDSMVFFRPGDIVKFKPINREEYDRAEAQVEDGSFALRIRPVSFSLAEFLRAPQSCNARLLETLHG